MKAYIRLFLFLIALTPVALLAQAGTSIGIEGGMTVGQGGRAKTAGLVYDNGQGPQGHFTIAFSSGDLVNLNLSRITMYSVPTGTAFFGGTATSVVRENGVTRKVSGQFTVMVDDLDLDQLPFPDQFFLRFEYEGKVIIRHGLFTDGDVKIALTP